MHMKIGIYGGTFDPVHMGHIFVARSVKQELGLDRVDFVVAADPPHKHSAERTPAALRFDMVCACIPCEASTISRSQLHCFHAARNEADKQESRAVFHCRSGYA